VKVSYLKSFPMSDSNKPPSLPDTCETCKYNRNDTCRFKPPGIIGWPRITKTDWCSEYHYVRPFHLQRTDGIHESFTYAVEHNCMIGGWDGKKTPEEIAYQCATAEEAIRNSLPSDRYSKKPQNIFWSHMWKEYGDRPPSGYGESVGDTYAFLGNRQISSSGRRR